MISLCPMLRMIFSQPSRAVLATSAHPAALEDDDKFGRSRRGGCWAHIIATGASIEATGIGKLLEIKQHKLACTASSAKRA